MSAAKVAGSYPFAANMLSCQDVENMCEFLAAEGYSSDRRDRVVLRDDRHTDPEGPFWYVTEGYWASGSGLEHIGGCEICAARGTLLPPPP